MTHDRGPARSGVPAVPVHWGALAVLAAAALTATEWLVSWATEDGRPAPFALGVALMLALAAFLVTQRGPAGRIAATVILAFGLLRALDAVGDKAVVVQLLAFAEIGLGALALTVIWVAATRD
ncbi:hypothetical protein [Spirillospora sp. CA-294931]|uniref:hypothetical protein n=1 Tax=Spirillospora sp. CA-294931 TaxID=3240042 RepID=UPI003D89BD1E